MYDRKTLGLEEAMAAITAVIDRAKRDGERCVAVCVVDKSAEIIASARMDGLHRGLERRHTARRTQPRYSNATHPAS